MKPTFIVVAGPNGSGKSTLTRGANELFQDLPILDPDAIARVIENQYEGHSNIEAGKRVLRQVQAYLGDGTSFSVETTLSGKWILSAMQSIRNAGFKVQLVFVGINSVEKNITRVKHRVFLGGHDVPEEDIRRRYVRSFANLAKAIRLADESLLFDNSTDQGYREIASLGPQEQIWSDDLPSWASKLRDELS